MILPVTDIYHNLLFAYIILMCAWTLFPVQNHSLSAGLDLVGLPHLRIHVLFPMPCLFLASLSHCYLAWSFHSNQWKDKTMDNNNKDKNGISKTSGLPWWFSSNDATCSAGDSGSSPGSGRSPTEGHGSPCQYSCLGDPMDRGGWQATVHGVASIGHELITKPLPSQRLLGPKINIRDYIYSPCIGIFIFTLAWAQNGIPEDIECLLDHHLCEGRRTDYMAYRDMFPALWLHDKSPLNRIKMGSIKTKWNTSH